MIYSKHHRLIPKESSSTLVLAGAGSGVSNWVKSNLLQADENFIVMDPNGEYVKATGNFLKESGYIVQTLNLISPEKGSHYNPFVYECSDSRIQNIVDAILKNTKEQREDGYFNDAERKLLCAIMACFLETESNTDNLTMQNFVQFVETLSAPAKEDGFFKRIENVEEDSISKRYYDAFQEYVSDKIKDAVCISCLVDVQNLFTESMLKCMEKDELHLDEWKDEKKALFIITHPVEQKNTSVLPILFSQLFDFLSSEVNSWKHSLHCIMDEFRSCGVIPNINNALLYEGEGFHVTCILQELSQMEECYKVMSSQYLNSFKNYLLLGKPKEDEFPYFIKRLHTPVNNLETLKKKQCLLMLKGWKKPDKDKAFNYKRHSAYKKTGDRKASQLYSID